MRAFAVELFSNLSLLLNFTVMKKNPCRSGRKNRILITWPFLQPPTMMLLSRGQTVTDVTSLGHSRISLGDKQSVKDHISTRLLPSQAKNTCL